MLSIRSTSTWISCALVLALLPACVSADKYMRLENEYANLQADLLFAQDQLTQAEQALTDGTMSQDEFEQLKVDLAAARAENDRLAQKYIDVENRGAIDGFDTFRAANNMVGFRGESDIFFASGKHGLTADGKRALDALVSRELDRNDGPVQVVGHTDSDPINKTKDIYTEGNIHLGMMRAISVRKYLVSRGIEESRISVASWGEHKPLAQGGGKDAKARNRRVEILVQI
jgi:outer membrane protein OmpA-like peptidoglycan-associated protein